MDNKGIKGSFNINNKFKKRVLLPLVFLLSLIGNYDGKNEASPLINQSRTSSLKTNSLNTERIKSSMFLKSIYSGLQELSILNEVTPRDFEEVNIEYLRNELKNLESDDITGFHDGYGNITIGELNDPILEFILTIHELLHTLGANEKITYSVQYALIFITYNKEDNSGVEGLYSKYLRSFRTNNPTVPESFRYSDNEEGLNESGDNLDSLSLEDFTVMYNIYSKAISALTERGS